MRVFLDTNVLAYQFDADSPHKRDRAISVLENAAPDGIVSTQVLLELYSVLTRKLGFSTSKAAELLGAVDLDVVGTDRTLVLDAARTAAAHQLSIWDAMILEAAVRAGCDELWTENLAAGTTLRGVRIVDPFQA